MPEKVKPYLAMIDGERKFFKRIIDTNVCMSNPEARKIIAEYIADYAEIQNNVDFLHIWLADARSNHCECDECRKKIPSDWYVMLLNNIDSELTKRGLDTNLVFIAYTDTLWAPIEERLNNKKRFKLFFAPFYRSYTSTYDENPDPSQLTPFNLNHNTYPRSIGGYLAYLNEWKKDWDGDCFCYEYHMWRAQYQDLTTLEISKIIYGDIVALKKNGLDGIIQCGAPRSFLPTGLAYYVFGEALYDSSVSFDDLVEDYFSHAFGADWKKVAAYLTELSYALPYKYYYGKMSSDYKIGAYYNPELAESIIRTEKIVSDFLPVIEANKNQTHRVWTVAWQLLNCHKDFVRIIAKASAKKAIGDTEGCKEEFLKFLNIASEREVYFERYYDLNLWIDTIQNKFM